MALRYLLLIPLLGWTAAPHVRASVRTYPLDPRTVTTITVSPDEPTTCVLPSAPTALEGAGVAAQPGEEVGVLLSYQPGQNFFSLRALRPDAKAGLNIVWQGRVIALRIITGAGADRSVLFQGDPPEKPVGELRELLDRAKWHGLRAAQTSTVLDTTVRVQPRSVTHYRDFTVTLEEVFRFEAENALVFHLRLENRGSQSVAYDPEGLGVRVGRETWIAELADASGGIPAHGTAEAFILVTAPVRATASFNVIVPAP